MDKVLPSAAAAVADVPDGASILFGGFGVVQAWPNSLLLALRDRGASGLTLIFNTPGVGPLSAQILVTGVEDPLTAAHGPNESLHLGEFAKVCLAEALLLQRLGSL